MLNIDIKSKNRNELIKAYKKTLHMIKDNEYGLNSLSPKEIEMIKTIKKQIRDEIAIKDCIKKGASIDVSYKN